MLPRILYYSWCVVCFFGLMMAYHFSMMIGPCPIRFMGMLSCIEMMFFQQVAGSIQLQACRDSMAIFLLLLISKLEIVPPRKF